MAGEHDRLQSQCFIWLHNEYPMTRKLCWHTPNEQRPHPHETKHAFMLRIQQAKAIGVVKGVVDLVFYWRGILYMFDIKIGADRLSEDQKEFIRINERHGGKFYEIKNLDEFKNIIITLQIK